MILIRGTTQHFAKISSLCFGLPSGLDLPPDSVHGEPHQVPVSWVIRRVKIHFTDFGVYQACGNGQIGRINLYSKGYGALDFYSRLQGWHVHKPVPSSQLSGGADKMGKGVS